MGFFSDWRKQKRFHQLYLDHQEFIRATLYWVGPSLEVDDLVQETFVKAWKGWDKFEGLAQPKTWLYRIAMNVAKDALRKLKNEVEYDDHRASALSKSEFDLKWALQDLSFEQKESLILSFFWGYTLKEIAGLTGRPEGTIKSQIHHGKIKLGQALKEGEKHE